MTGTEAERERLLDQLEDWLETPMLVLGLAWLALLVVELVSGLPPLLEAVGTAIWIVFVLEFLLRLALAPGKGRFLARNVLTIAALALPALRVLRITRAFRLMRIARAARGLRLFRVVSSMNRGMRALRTSLGHAGFGYVAALTLLVTLAGAAGMLAFERESLGDYGTALWWTAMVMTTMGSEHWPRTPEGRVLCLLLALYAFAVFGYVTATLASFLIGRDARSTPPDDSNRLRREIAELRERLRSLERQRS